MVGSGGMVMEAWKCHGRISTINYVTLNMVHRNILHSPYFMVFPFQKSWLYILHIQGHNRSTFFRFWYWTVGQLISWEIVNELPNTFLIIYIHIGNNSTRSLHMFMYLTFPLYNFFSSTTLWYLYAELSAVDLQ